MSELAEATVDALLGLPLGNVLIGLKKMKINFTNRLIINNI